MNIKEEETMCNKSSTSDPMTKLEEQTSPLLSRKSSKCSISSSEEEEAEYSKTEDYQFENVTNSEVSIN